MDGGGPPYIKLARRCLYRPDDVEAWLRERTVTDTADAARRFRDDV